MINYLNVYKVSATPTAKEEEVNSYVEHILYYVGENVLCVEAEVKQGGYNVNSIEHMFRANYQGTGF